MTRTGRPAIELHGIATATPAHAVSQRRAAELALELTHAEAGHRRLLPVLYRRSGVDRRHSVLLREGGTLQPEFYPIATSGSERGPGTAARMQVYEEQIAALAMQAGAEALARADCPPQAITHVVTVSCSGFVAPGFDLALIERLDLPLTTERTHVGFMGCHGALNGLRAAAALAAADPRARVLLCAAELCSIHYQYSEDHEQIVANALFADGAAAAVVRAAAPNGNGHTAQTPVWRVRGHGAGLVPASADAMSWRIGDHGFTMTLSARVPELIERHLPAWLDAWLATQDCAREAITQWAVHPGGPRILQAVEQALALPAEALAVSRGVLASHGNMSSPTILFILEQLAAAGQMSGPTIALAFGPGLSIEGALLERL